MNKKFQDKDYWIEYYERNLNNLKNNPPSPFAKYLVENKYLEKPKKIIELGCGNGRDSIYFSKNNSLVTAVDQCENTTKLLNECKNIDSFPADFTNLSAFPDLISFDIVYSRFTIHSIDENGEDRTLNWAYDSLVNGGLLCIEARTTKDPLCGKGEYKGDYIWFFNNHHRRFVDAKRLKKKIESIGFNIKYFLESNGLAKYKNEDPIVLRLIAQK